MLLAVDIGNSSVKFGIFDDKKLVSLFKIPTVRTQTGDEIYSQIKEKLNENFSGVIVSSVVPELKNSFTELGKKFFGCETIFVDNTFDFGLKIKYNPPENLGVDRIVAAFAAVEKYEKKPCIVCDFGTATTIDAVNSAGEYLGGIIAPGMRTLAESLKLRTSKLPLVELKKPDSIIGNSTVSSIQSGVFYGYIGLTEGILQRMISELNEKPLVVATGGDAKLIAENCSLIDIVDEVLMLEGLYFLFKKIS